MFSLQEIFNELGELPAAALFIYSLLLTTILYTEEYVHRSRIDLSCLILCTRIENDKLSLGTSAEHKKIVNVH